MQFQGGFIQGTPWLTVFYPVEKNTEWQNFRSEDELARNFDILCYLPHHSYRSHDKFLPAEIFGS